VLFAILMTWAVPVGVFFTSIIGWQYFVGYRSVPPGKCYVHNTPNPPKGDEGKCYVQYMDEALFNCLLQVGYFWITLNAMIALPRGERVPGVTPGGTACCRSATSGSR